MAISLYNKYRPKTFDDVVGQTEILKTLKNALDFNLVSHAYLFTGPAGTGKTTTARLLAKALLCGDSPTSTPDGTCPECIEVAQGIHPDVYELDAATRTGVDNVREEIINNVAFSPIRGKYKVYIIDEVHMLSTSAFNALLKTLEEPPEKVVFILCTTDPHKVPATIIARCQRFDFKRLSTKDIEVCLRGICVGEGFEYDEAALEMIALFANGGMRDAITALEQVSINGNRSVKTDVVERTFGQTDMAQLDELARLIAARDIPACFIWLDTFFETGVDAAQFVSNMVEYYRNLYVLLLTGSPIGFEELEPDRVVKLDSIAKSYSASDRVARILIILADLEYELKTPVDIRLAIEICLLKIARPTADLTLESLNERLVALEHKVRMGSFVDTNVSAASSTVPTTANQASESALQEQMSHNTLSNAGSTQNAIKVAPDLDTAESSIEGIPEGVVERLNAIDSSLSMSVDRLISEGAIEHAEEYSAERASGNEFEGAANSKETAKSERAANPEGTTRDIAPTIEQAAEIQETSDKENLSRGLDSASLQRRFLKAVDSATKESVTMQALLGGALPHIGATEDELLIELPYGSSFNMEILQGKEKFDVLAKHVREAFLRPMRIHFYLGEQGGNQTSVAPTIKNTSSSYEPEADLAEGLKTNSTKSNLIGESKLGANALDQAKEVLKDRFGTDIEIEEISD